MRPTRFTWLLTVPLALAGCHRDLDAEKAAWRALAEFAHAAQAKKLDCERKAQEAGDPSAAPPCYEAERQEFERRKAAYLGACARCGGGCEEILNRNREIGFPRRDGSPGAVDGPGIVFACGK